jgi:hypothetical protein
MEVWNVDALVALNPNASCMELRFVDTRLKENSSAGFTSITAVSRRMFCCAVRNWCVTGTVIKQPREKHECNAELRSVCMTLLQYVSSCVYLTVLIIWCAFPRQQIVRHQDIACSLNYTDILKMWMFCREGRQFLPFEPRKFVAQLGSDNYMEHSRSWKAILKEVVKKCSSLYETWRFIPCSQEPTTVLNELCFWTLSIVWCLKNKQN